MFILGDLVNCSLKLYLEKRLFSHHIISFLFLLDAGLFSVLYYNFEFTNFDIITSGSRSGI